MCMCVIGDRNGGGFLLGDSRDPGEAWLRARELHFPPSTPVKRNVLSTCAA